MRGEGAWDWANSPDTDSYLDSMEFKQYAAAIRDIVHRSETPVSIGDIHRALKRKARMEWTADAIDSIKDIQTVSLLPTRYQPLNRRIAGLTAPSGDLPLVRRKADNYAVS